MERSKEGTKERLNYQNTMLIKIIWYCYKIWKKYNEIQLTKTKIDLNNPKMTSSTSHPTLLFLIMNVNKGEIVTGS